MTIFIAVLSSFRTFVRPERRVPLPQPPPSFCHCGHTRGRPFRPHKLRAARRTNVATRTSGQGTGADGCRGTTDGRAVRDERARFVLTDSGSGMRSKVSLPRFHAYISSKRSTVQYVARAHCRASRVTNDLCRRAAAAAAVPRPRVLTP